MQNFDIAKIFYNIADILELQEIQFKPRAYRNAARAIEELSENLKEIYKQGKLKDIPGIGESIALKIEEILRTGKLKYYEDLKKELKINLEELNQIPSLGPKKIKILYQKLKIKNIRELEHALHEHKIKELAGFGEETEKNLLRGIELLKSHPKRMLWYQALPIVNQLKQHLHTIKSIPNLL